MPLESRDVDLAIEAFDLRGYAIAPAAAVRGVVREGDGKLLAGAWISLRMVDEGGGFAGQEHWSTLTDRAGRFVIAGLEPRAYGLRVFTTGETPAGPRKLLDLEAGKPAEVELVAR